MMSKKIIFVVIIALLSLWFACSNRNAEPMVSPPVQKTFYRLTDSGKMYQYQGNGEIALFYHRQALKHAQLNNLQLQQAEALVHIARLLPSKETDTSLRYLGYALAIARSLKHNRLQSDIYRSIAEIHKQQHNYISALFALEAHQVLTDSLLNERRRKDLYQLKIKQNVAQERTIVLSVLLGLFAIAVTLGLYFQKTRKLNRKLEQSIAVRDKLFSIISHDLRGPAGSLKQALELIDIGAIAAEELPEFMSMLKNQSAVLNDTLDTLLVWSRSQLNEITQNPVKFPLLTLINKNLTLLEGQYKSKGLSFKIDFPSDDNIYADQDQFDFIIRNLVSNAIKFSLPGGEIEITLRKKSHLAELTVCDHGIGISKERQAKFLNGDLDTTFGTSGEKGTGLGLRMVKDFIYAAGGTLTIESKKGDTCFNLKFNYPSK